MHVERMTLFHQKLSLCGQLLPQMHQRVWLRKKRQQVESVVVVMGPQQQVEWVEQEVVKYHSAGYLTKLVRDAVELEIVRMHEDDTEK